MTDAYGRIRDRRDEVSRTFITMNQLVEDEVVGPGRAATAAAREARERLHQLGCLSFALEQRIRDLEALDGPRDALAAAPCEVRFTSATGEPARDEAMPVARIVDAAREHEREIRRAVRAVQLGAEIDARARHLRGEVAKLHELVAGARSQGLGPGGEPVPAEVRAVLDRLDRVEAAADGDRRAGGTADDDLPAAVDRAAGQVTARRRAWRQRCHTELTGRLEGYRQKAIDEGLGERLDLEESYQAARTALRPDRFDTVPASRAVLAYQHDVNGAVT